MQEGSKDYILYDSVIWLTENISQKCCEIRSWASGMYQGCYTHWWIRPLLSMLLGLVRGGSLGCDLQGSPPSPAPSFLPALA